MLSQTAEYALRVAVCLAREPERAHYADAELATAQTQTPRRYLHKVLQDMALAKLVQSRPGPGGGYFLLPSADDLTILQVVNAVAPVEPHWALPPRLAVARGAVPAP